MAGLISGAFLLGNSINLSHNHVKPLSFFIVLSYVDIYYAHKVL